jgi:hypothetical protein
MGRKKFEETEYDPIEAEAKRTLARQVSQVGVPTSVVDNVVRLETSLSLDEPRSTSSEVTKERAFITPKKRSFASVGTKTKKAILFLFQHGSRFRA